MKILHLNTSDIIGGAARATYRLHNALLNEGINSQMLVQKKMSDDYTVIGPETKIGKGWGQIRPTLDMLPVLFYKNRTKTLFSPNWLPFSPIVRRINEIKPDIVHLHWIAGGMMRIEDIAKITAPVVWSLHDMWALTGGCHYDEGCGKFKTKCNCCPVLGSDKVSDLSSKVFHRKKKVFQRIKNLTIIGLSRWLADCAQKSALFKNRSVVNLPNPIDTDIFASVPKKYAKNILNFRQDKKIILFGAMSGSSDPRKGFKYLSSALQKLNTEDIELAVFGSTEPCTPPTFKQHVRYLGHLHDDISLRVLYSAADVMIVPSLQEAFGQTASEAMACGTPVVAFGATGLLDIVEHKKTGYLATPFDANDLAQGIDWILHAENYQELCKNARNKVLQDFDSKIVAKKYIELYKRILDDSSTQ